MNNGEKVRNAIKAFHEAEAATCAAGAKLDTAISDATKKLDEASAIEIKARQQCALALKNVHSYNKGVVFEGHVYRVSRGENDKPILRVELFDVVIL